MSGTTPPMPATQEEWEAHWAFYRLTVAQRDDAWAENARLVEAIRMVAKLAPSVQGVVKKEDREWVPLYERTEVFTDPEVSQFVLFTTEGGGHLVVDTEKYMDEDAARGDR